MTTENRDDDRRGAACDICDEPTRERSGRCNRCWALLREIQAAPDLARKCLAIAAPQPAPETGEWHYATFNDCYSVYDNHGWHVATTDSEQHAAQIVRDHNAVARLAAALREVEAMLNKELARDYESQTWAKQVRAALVAHDAAISSV